MNKPAAAILLATGVPLLASCATTGATSGSAPPSHTLRVGLVEWRILTSSAALTAGTDRLLVTNTGTTAHDLHVSGQGVHVHTPLLSPGASAALRLTTRAGTVLTLTCDVPGHDTAGMHTSLSVTGPGATAGEQG